MGKAEPPFLRLACRQAGSSPAQDRRTSSATVGSLQSRCGRNPPDPPQFGGDHFQVGSDLHVMHKAVIAIDDADVRQITPVFVALGGVSSCRGDLRFWPLSR